MTILVAFILSCSVQNLEFAFSNADDPKETETPDLTQASPFSLPQTPSDLALQADTFAHDTQPFHFFAGSGVLVADFDGDDWLDIYIPTAQEDELYLGGPNRQFTKADDWIRHGSTLSVGGAVADYDGDGDMDIFLAITQGNDILLRNEGSYFEDVSFQANIMPIPSDSTCVSWVDFDFDGDLDLAIGANKDVPQGREDDDIPPGDPTMIYTNMGNGQFQATEIPILEREGRTFAISWIQAASLQQPYLYIINDSMGAPAGQETPNTLYTWDDGSLALAPESSGLQVSMNGMGVAMADLNHDQLPDILVTNEGPPALFLSMGDGQWYNGALSHGLGAIKANQYFSWGASIHDFNNDGDLDIWMGYGPALDMSKDEFTEEPDAFLENNGSQFIDKTETWGITDYTNTRGGIFVDIDKDGALDLIRSPIQSPVSIFYGTETHGAWLYISVMQEGMNKHGIGARIEVQKGDQIWTRWITSGTSTASGEPPIAHFGLGDIEIVDEIRVYWPTGEVTIWENIDTRQYLTIDQ